MTKKKKHLGRLVTKAPPTAGERIIEGIKEALAWSQGQDVPVRVTQVRAPEIDVSAVRRRMGLRRSSP